MLEQLTGFQGSLSLGYHEQGVTEDTDVLTEEGLCRMRSGVSLGEALPFSWGWW